MSTLVTSLLIALGLGVIVVRRRSIALKLVAAQSIVLGVIAISLARGQSVEFVIAGGILLVKGALLPVLLSITRRRTREPRLVAPATSMFKRFVITVFLVLIAVALTPTLGLGDFGVERSAVALVVIGIAAVILRRPALMQILGIFVAENGVYLLAIHAPGGMPFLIELGVLVDVALTLTVASAFTYKIHEEFGSSNTELLRDLND